MSSVIFFHRSDDCVMTFLFFFLKAVRKTQLMGDKYELFFSEEEEGPFTSSPR